MSEQVQTAPTSESIGTVEEAASKIEALLSGKKPTRKQEAPVTEAAQETSDDTLSDDVSTEDDTAETPLEADEADYDADETPQPDTEDDAESDQEPEQLYTVKINGKEEKIPLKEALAGYQRQEDYTRSKQALAAEKNQFSGELQAAKQEREVYSQLLPALMQRMQASLTPAPDSSLIDTNPSAYLRQKEAHERELGDLQAAASEMQRMQEDDRVEQQRKVQAYVADNAAKLPDLVPEWKDKKAYERDKPKVREYLMSVGFSNEEINQAYDARLVKLAADGMRWRALQSNKPKPNAPPLQKALKPSPAPAQPQTKTKRDGFAARQRLASSGRVEDAAAAIRALL